MINKLSYIKDNTLITSEQLNEIIDVLNEIIEVLNNGIS